MTWTEFDWDLDIAEMNSREAESSYCRLLGRFGVLEVGWLVRV